MTPNSMTIWPILVEAAISPKAEQFLIVENTGNLNYRPLSKTEANLKLLGLGPASRRTLRNHLIQHQAILKLEAENIQTNVKTVWPVQNLLNSLFNFDSSLKNIIKLKENTYANWMGNLNDEQRNLPFDRLILPGTHDSASYQLDILGTPSDQTYIKAAKFAQYIPGIKQCVNSLIGDWSRAQSNTLYQQLQQGIRSLDLRITANTNKLMKTEFYISHTFSCIPLNEALAQISLFLAKHKQEVILIHAKLDWEHRSGFNPNIEQQFASIVSEGLKPYLCYKSERNNRAFGSFKLQNLINLNERIIFMYESNTFNFGNNPLIWEQTTNSIWNDTSDELVLVFKVSEEINQYNLKQLGETNYRLNAINYHLTPQKKDVLKGIANRFLPLSKRRNLFSQADKFNKTLSDLLPNLNLNNINVVNVDLCSCNGAVADIIERNKTLSLPSYSNSINQLVESMDIASNNSRSLRNVTF